MNVDYATSRRAAAGFGLGIAGIAALSSMDAVAKSLGAHIPVLEIVLARHAGAALWIALFLVITRRAWPKRKNFGRHALRGAILTLTAFLFFYGVQYLPLAMATALAMSAPIYVSVLSIIFLGERASWGLVFSLCAGATGSLIIIFGGAASGATSEIGVFAWAAAILAPLSYASALVLLKHHANDEGAATMTMAQSVAGSLIILPFAVPTLVMPLGAEWLLIILIGALGAIGFLLLITGLRRLPASLFSTVDYTALIWSALLGLTFFGEGLELRIIVGGSLIIFGCWIGAQVARKSPDAKHSADKPTVPAPDAN